MFLRATYNIIAFAPFLCSLNAAAQQEPRLTERTANLNEVFVHAHGLRKMEKKKARATDVTMVFSPTNPTKGSYWDSTYFLTRFEPPARTKFKLVNIEGRLHDFDTTKINVYLVVAQTWEGDTMVKEIPIKLIPGNRKKNKFVIDVRENSLILQPGVFYLGYSFRTKNLVEEYSYKLYSTFGGEAALLKRKNGRWHIWSRPSYFPSVYPFTVSYLEL